MKNKTLKSFTIAIFLLIISAGNLQAQEAFLGEIKMFAGNFPTRGWAFCDGQILSIAQNTALFSLLGTTYGGNGQTTFALPDLRGRVPVHAGATAGPGLTKVNLGQSAGTETVILISNNLPPHTHNVEIKGVELDGNTHLPTGAYPANTKLLDKEYYKPASGETPALKTMQTVQTSTAGSAQPINNMQPYLGVNYIICLEGIFPSRY